MLNHDPKAKALLNIYQEFCDHAQIFLGYGAVLGLVRDGELMAHDNSIEFFARFEDWTIHTQTVFTIESEGRAAISHMECDNRYGREKWVLISEGFRFAIVAWHDKGRYRVRRYLRLPQRMWTGESLSVGNSLVSVLSPVEEYLSWQYRDWRTPVPPGISSLHYSGRKCLRQPRQVLYFRKLVSSATRRLGLAAISRRIEL